MQPYRLFFHEGVPYGETAVSILEEGRTLLLEDGSRIALADVEIQTVTLAKAKEIFSKQHA